MNITVPYYNGKVQEYQLKLFFFSYSSIGLIKLNNAIIGFVLFQQSKRVVTVTVFNGMS